MNYLTWSAAPPAWQCCTSVQHLPERNGESGRGAKQRLFTEGFNKLSAGAGSCKLAYSNLQTSTEPPTKGGKEYIACGISSPD